MNSNTFVSPPGAMLQEYLESFDYSQKEFSILTGITERRLSNIINDKAVITVSDALMFEKVFEGTDASFWIQIQSSYDLEMERYSLNIEHKLLQEFADNYKLATLIDYSYNSVKFLVYNGLKVFGVNSIDEADKAAKEVAEPLLNANTKDYKELYSLIKLTDLSVTNTFRFNESTTNANSFILRPKNELFEQIKNLINNNNSLSLIEDLIHFFNAYGLSIKPIKVFQQTDITSFYLSSASNSQVIITNFSDSLFQVLGHLLYLINDICKNKKDTRVILQKKIEDKKLSVFYKEFFIKDLSSYTQLVNTDITTRIINKYSKEKEIPLFILVELLKIDGVIANKNFRHLQIKV